MKRHLKGTLGTAERILAKPLNLDQTATLAGWTLHLPGFAIWDYYYVTLIHLREIPGVPPAKKRYPDAAYELMVAAIDPALGRPRPNDDPTWRFSFLTPLNYVNQFDGITDEQAVQIAEWMVRAFLDGVMPIEPAAAFGMLNEQHVEMPFTLPYRGADLTARDYFALMIGNTIEHLLTGGHPEEGKPQ